MSSMWLNKSLWTNKGGSSSLFRNPSWQPVVVEEGGEGGKVCCDEDRAKESRWRRTRMTINRDEEGVIREVSGAKSTRAASSAKLVPESEP